MRECWTLGKPISLRTEYGAFRTKIKEPRNSHAQYSALSVRKSLKRRRCRSAFFVRPRVPGASFLVLGISYEVLIARTEYYGQRMPESGRSGHAAQSPRASLRKKKLSVPNLAQRPADHKWRGSAWADWSAAHSGSMRPDSALHAANEQFEIVQFLPDEFRLQVLFHPVLPTVAVGVGSGELQPKPDLLQLTEVDVEWGRL